MQFCCLAIENNILKQFKKQYIPFIASLRKDFLLGVASQQTLIITFIITWISCHTIINLCRHHICCYKQNEQPTNKAKIRTTCTLCVHVHFEKAMAAFFHEKKIMRLSVTRQSCKKNSYVHFNPNFVLLCLFLQKRCFVPLCQ